MMHGAVVAAVLTGVGSQLILRQVTGGLNHDTAAALTAVLPLIAVLTASTALVLMLGGRLGNERKSSISADLLLILIGGLTMRLVWLGVPPPLEDDYYRYLVDGAAVARGLNPYLHAPEALVDPRVAPAGYEALAETVQGVVQKVNFPDLRTIYPGAAQAAFALAYLIAPMDVDGLRIVFIVAEGLTVWAMLGLITRLGGNPLWVALYWLNPLVAYVLIAIAHVDALVPTFVIGGLYLAAAGSIASACVLIGLGAGVKIWPILLVPLLLWRLRRAPARLVLACFLLGTVLLAVLGPLGLSALTPGSGLTAYASGWSNHNAIYAWTAHWAGLWLGDSVAQAALRSLSAAIVGITALTLAVRSAETPKGLVTASLVVAALVFYLSPAQFPWYLVWFLPLAALVPCWPLLFASVVISSYYLFFPLWAAGQGALYFYAVGFVHALPVLGWLGVRWWQRQSWHAEAG
ncbi:MAG: hypothetical protein ACFCUN_11845 [Hyphomicrobiaceae bacterium]